MLRHLRPSSELSDEELLNRYRSRGELSHLGQLYDRYLELVYGVCLKYLGEEAAAEDAVMAIFEELVEKVRKHDIKTFRSWLYVLAKNHCLMALRKKNREMTVTLEPTRMQSVDSRHHNMEEPEDEETLEKLRHCIKGLAEQQKHCIELFYYEGKSYKEIALIKKEELGKIRSHIQNGRRNLKICMEKT